MVRMCGFSGKSLTGGTQNIPQENQNQSYISQIISEVCVHQRADKFSRTKVKLCQIYTENLVETQFNCNFMKFVFEELRNTPNIESTYSVLQAIEAFVSDENSSKNMENGKKNKGLSYQGRKRSEWGKTRKNKRNADTCMI